MTWSTEGGAQSSLFTCSMSLDTVVSGPGTKRCRKRLVCTILLRLPSQISAVTGLFIDVIAHSPSHLGSSFPAVGIDNQTGSPSTNVGCVAQ